MIYRRNEVLRGERRSRNVETVETVLDRDLSALTCLNFRFLLRTVFDPSK